MKMKKGKAWIIIGLLCIAAALLLTVYNIRDSKRAQREAQAALSELLGEINPDPVPAEGRMRGRDAMEYPDYVLNPDMDLPHVLIEGVEYVGKLSIPTLSLELPVCGQWDYELLKIGPCRYSGTPYKDNIIVCAHNYVNQFGNLTGLSYGDPIVFTDMDGNEFRYEVIEIIVLKPTAVDEMMTGDWDLTLFTCTPGGAARETVRCIKV